MSSAKKRVEQHLIDQDGEKLLREKLPRHWMLRDYRPDYGLDFTIETFKNGAVDGRPGIYETLGEHLFVQLKSVAAPKASPLTVYERSNVEKGPEVLKKGDRVAKINTYRFSLETSELLTVERMGIAVPVLLVIADLSARRCSFVCLNDYIDKILVPRHTDYRAKGSRTIYVPVCNEVESGTREIGTLRWYAKRPKLLAAFQRFNYQYSELQWAAEETHWRNLANNFACRIADYDFWHDTENWGIIRDNAARLEQFVRTGQPGFFEPPGKNLLAFDEPQLAKYFQRLDVLELWRQLSQLSKIYEEICREWFLPTALGYITSAA